MQLVIDLSKGRPKGSRNKNHKWIALYVNARGETIRIYPDTHHGELVGEGEEEQFKLKPGVTVNQVLHEKLIGGHVTGFAPGSNRTKPRVQDGEFVRYVVVSASEYRDAVAQATKRGYKNPYKEDAIFTDKIGKDWLVFGYPKAHAVEKDSDDKPTRFAGFNRIEYHPSVKAAGYRTPKKIEQFQFDAAHVPHHAIPEGGRVVGEAYTPAHGDKGVKRVATVHPLSDDRGGPLATPPAKKEHDLSTESIARREQLEGITITDASDPLDVAAKIVKKFKLDKPGTSTRANFADWQLAKFPGHELNDKLQHQPVGALISLGVMQSTSRSKRLNDALVEEWTPIIMGMAGDNFAAFKETPDYRQAVARDEERTARGLKRNKNNRVDSNVYVKELKRQTTSDLFQDGVEKLLNIARKYDVAKDDPNRRFDRLAFVAVSNEIKKQSRLRAEQAKTDVPIVHESDVDQAMRQNARGGGSMEPLSPHENAELKRVTPIARRALYEAVSKLSQAERRVIEARLWLDEPDEGGVPMLDAAPSEEERLTRKKRQEKFDERIASAEEKGEVVARRKPTNWQREWSGQGSIAEKYRGWTDPDTNETFDINEYSQSGQRELLQRYYQRGVASLMRELSVPIGRQRPMKGGKPVVHPDAFQPNAEWRQHENHVMVQLTSSEIKNLSAEDQLAYVALGGQPRVLTQQGKAVKRYLQIEAKLATQNRRRWMDPAHVREMDSTTTMKPNPFKVVGKQFPTPRVAHDIRYESPRDNQAIKWFTSSANQELATRLGMHDLATYAEQSYQRSGKDKLVGAGTHAESLFRRARKHYNAINIYNNMSDSELVREQKRITKEHSTAQHALRSPKDDDEHRAKLTKVTQLQAKLDLIDFVQTTKRAMKAIVVNHRDTVTSLAKAFLDFDFELDRLWVEFV